MDTQFNPQPPSDFDLEMPDCEMPMPDLPPQSKKKGPGIGTRIVLRCIAILLSMALFATLLVGIVIYDGKEVISGDNLTTLLDELGTGDFRDNELLVALEDEIVYYINELFVHEYGSYYHLERDAVLNFLEQSTINDFLVDKAAGYVQDVVEGTRNTRITTEELKDLYLENTQLMEEELGINISPEIDEQVLKNLEKFDINRQIDEKLFGYLDNETNVDDDLRWALKMVSLIFSDSAFLVCIIVAVILAIALILSNRLRPAGSLVHIGLPMVLAGGVMWLPILFADTLLEISLNNIGMKMTGEVEKALAMVISKCSPILTPAPKTILIIGGVLVLLAPVAKLVFKKK